MSQDEAQVDPRANRKEKQAEQQALERFQIRFELVAVFAVREDHARQKGSQGSGEADPLHE